MWFKIHKIKPMFKLILIVTSIRLVGGGTKDQTISFLYIQGVA